MGVQFELEYLARVLDSYGFNTETWLIPSAKSHLKLNIKVASFVEEHEADDTLMIVYYGGHASISATRQSTWFW